MLLNDDNGDDDDDDVVVVVNTIKGVNEFFFFKNINGNT